jgi:GNAT superfamily N-acetyltransferase
MKTGNELIQIVHGYWSKRFNCEREKFVHPGTLILTVSELAESANVHLYHIDRMSVLRIDPSLAKRAGLPDGYQSDLGALDVSKLQALIPVELASTLLDFYLDPKDFQCFTAGDGLSTRQLDAENDKTTLLGLYQACTESDLDAAEVSIEEPDPVIFGIFDGTQLVAYAGHRYWDDVIADIGVLIHPEYRSRGLGKAVVSALCEWCFRNDIVPMYRVFMSHPHSRRIPEALGFRKLVFIETLKLIE